MLKIEIDIEIWLVGIGTIVREKNVAIENLLGCMSKRTEIIT